MRVFFYNEPPYGETALIPGIGGSPASRETHTRAHTPISFRLKMYQFLFMQPSEA